MYSGEAEEREKKKQRIELLVREGGQWEARPFDTAEAAEEPAEDED